MYRILALLFVLSGGLLVAGNAAGQSSAGVDATFTYQGLLEDGGTPSTGDFDFIFVLYDADIGGSSVGAGPLTLGAVQVVDGRFTVQLDFGDGVFDGEDRYLEVLVRPVGQGTYTTLSPRQPVLATPYASLALGVQGPLTIEADVPTSGDDANPSAAIRGRNTHLAQNSTDVTYGVYGEATSSSYSAVDGGHSAGVLGRGLPTTGSYVQGVRGEAGDLAGMPRPLGHVGVVGLGTSRGVAGYSLNGSGVYGSAEGNYGVWGQSETYRGVTGRTSRADNNWGIYTPDNLYSANVNLKGGIMQVVRNGGDDPVETGDVVVFHGIQKVAGEAPLVEVAKAKVASDTAVAGVVYSRFLLESIAERAEDDPPYRGETTPEGAVRPGEYMLLVVQGPALVKVDASVGAVKPGDRLCTSGRGTSVNLQEMAQAKGEAIAADASFAKALEHAAGGERLIYAFVSVR